MKNIYILSFLILLPILGFSQNCKYSKNEIDEFTGNKMIATSLDLIVEDSISGITGISAMQINDQKAIGFSFYLPKFFAISKGFKLMLLDTEKNVFELTFEDDLISDIGSSKSKLYNISTKFLLNEEMIENLKTRTFTKLRFYNNKGYTDQEIPEKHQKVIQNAINCLE